MRIQLLKKLGLEEITMDTGAMLMEEGRKGSKVYVLNDGKVVIKAKGKELATVDAEGAVLGEISALLATPHVATVTTLEESSFYIIPDFMTFIHDNPEACVNMAQGLAVRLVNMNNHLVVIKEDVQRLRTGLDQYLPIFPENVKAD